MAMLQDLRRLFRKKHSLSIEVGDSMANATANGADDTVRSGDPTLRTSSSIETKPMTPTRGGRGNTELQRSYEQVTELMRKIGDHLDDEASRHKRLESILERMPPALDVLPEINRQNANLLEVMTEYLEQSRQRENNLNETLSRITESTAQQTEVLGLLRQQMAVSNQSAQEMTTTLGEFRHTLGELGHSNARAIDVLAGMAAAAEQRESKLEQVIGRSQKWLIAALCVCGLSSIVALSIAIITLVRVPLGN